jgi:hypothetical protein
VGWGELDGIALPCQWLALPDLMARRRCACSLLWVACEARTRAIMQQNKKNCRNETGVGATAAE